jgi:hypothetical protein
MKYLKINNKFEATDYFNEMSKKIGINTVYRSIESSEHMNVITNVPTEIYRNPAIKVYSPPNTHDHNNNNHFISFLQNSFNFLHHNHPEIHLKHEDGKAFHCNHCYDNSQVVYFTLLNLSANNNLPVTSPICICYGYISKQVLPGTMVGNAVVNMENLVVHDWHFWNKINNFIIDLSVTKSGGIYGLDTKQIKWEKAEDHVFKYPPENTTYYGIDFSDHQEFMRFTNELFGNPSS